MAFRKVSVVEVREVLRLWLSGHGNLHAGRQMVVLLGDGAAGLGMGDWDSLVRSGVDVTMVCGNNGIWGLEKHPMQFVNGCDVAAELRPETRYDEVMRALGGHGEPVRTPDELGPEQRASKSQPGVRCENLMSLRRRVVRYES